MTLDAGERPECSITQPALATCTRPLTSIESRSMNMRREGSIANPTNLNEPSNRNEPFKNSWHSSSLQMPWHALCSPLEPRSCSSALSPPHEPKKLYHPKVFYQSISQVFERDCFRGPSSAKHRKPLVGFMASQSRAQEQLDSIGGNSAQVWFDVNVPFYNCVQ